MAGNQTLAELFVEIKLQNEKLLEALKQAEVHSNSSTKKMQSTFDTLNFKKLIMGAGGLWGLKQAYDRTFAPMIKASTDFEYQMRRVNTIFQLSSGTFSNYSKNVRNAAMAVGISPEGYASAVYEAASANIPFSRSITDTAVAAKLGIAGFTDTATALKLIALTMNAYGKEAGTATQIADKYLHVQNRGLTVIKEMGDALGRLIPFAATLNVEFSVMNGMVAALTASGLDAFETATALRSMMQALATPSEEQRKIWKVLGIQWGESKIAGDGLVKMLKEINDKTSGSITLANALGVNQRGLVGLLALGGKSYDMMTQFINENREAIDLNNTATEEMNQSFVRTMERSGSALKGFGGALGDFITKSGAVHSAFELLINGAIERTHRLQNRDTFKRMIEVGAEAERLSARIRNLTKYYGENDDRVKEHYNELLRLRELYQRLQNDLAGIANTTLEFKIHPAVKEMMSFMEGKEKFSPLKPGVTGFSPIIPKEKKKLTDADILALLEGTENAEKLRKKEREEAAKLSEFFTELESQKVEDEIKRYDQRSKKIDDFYDYQFEIDQRLARANADKTKSEEDQNVERLNNYWLTMEQQHKLDLQRIANSQKYNLQIEDIEFEQRKKSIENHDTYGYELIQLETEHNNIIKEIKANSDREMESSNIQHFNNMTGAVVQFADRYGDFLGQAVIQSKFSFQAISNAFAAMLSQMAAQIAGRAAMFAILNMVSPGKFAFPGIGNQ